MPARPHIALIPLSFLAALAYSQDVVAPTPSAPIDRVKVPPTYSGPAGGGVPVNSGPVGGGNVEPEPPDPGSGGGGPPVFTGPGGRVLSPPPLPPSIPPVTGGVTPSRPSGAPGRGPDPVPPPRPDEPADAPVPGATVDAAGLQFSSEIWQNWWLFNQARYLDLRRHFAARSHSPEADLDTFFGAAEPRDLSSPVDRHRTQVDAEIFPLLHQALADASAAVRSAAVLALGKLGSGREVARLALALQDPNRQVRESAALALGLTKDASALPRLAAFLVQTNSQNSERVHAALALGLLGRREALVPLLMVINRGDEDREVRAAATLALGLIPNDEARARLSELAENPGLAGEWRSVAALALGLQATADSAELLMKLSQDGETIVRRSAIIALGRLSYVSAHWERRAALAERIRGWEERTVLSASARRALDDHMAEVEAAATAETDRRRELERRVVKVLAKALDRDADRSARHFAALSLGRLGSPEAISELLRVLPRSASRGATRDFVVLALGVARAEPAAGELRRNFMRREGSPSSREAMALSLGLLEDEIAAPLVLQEALEGGDPSYRGWCLLSVGLTKNRKARAALVDLLGSPKRPEMRPALGMALAELGVAESISILTGLLDQERSSQDRLYTISALSALHDLRTLRALATVVKDATESDVVRAAAFAAIGAVGEKSSLPALLSLSEDWNYLLPFPTIHRAVLR